MKNPKLTASLLTGALLLSQVTPAFAAENLENHWAAKALSTWQNYGIINGDENGNINPDKPITRAEFTTILDNMMDYQVKAQNTFSDLDNSWYTDAILGANAAGIINGYEDASVKPSANITRQEAVVMFARVLDLDVDSAPTASYSDISSVGSWALPAVNAMTAKKYISGSNNMFRPTDNITRAEVVTIINNIFASYISKSGTYTEDVTGSAVVSADGVVLKDMNISGDLIIAEGVGRGHIELDNVTVGGRLIVRGGGENSVIIKGNSSIASVSVSRQDGSVRISVEGTAKVSTVIVDDGSDAVKIEGTVDTINIYGEGAAVEVTGTVGTIEVAETAKSAELKVSETAKVENVKTEASSVAVSVAGTVTNVTVSGSNTAISTSEGAKIESVTTSGANTSVTGEGTVSKVEAAEGSTGTKVETKGTKVENNGSGEVTTGNGTVIKPGESGTATGGTQGSTGGGSTGGGSTTPSVPSNMKVTISTMGQQFSQTLTNNTSMDLILQTLLDNVNYKADDIERFLNALEDNTKQQMINSYETYKTDVISAAQTAGLSTADISKLESLLSDMNPNEIFAPDADIKTAILRVTQSIREWINADANRSEAAVKTFLTELNAKYPSGTNDNINIAAKIIAKPSITLSELYSQYGEFEFTVMNNNITGSDVSITISVKGA